MAIQHLSHKQLFTLEILNILYIFVMAADQSSLFSTVLSEA